MEIAKSLANRFADEHPGRHDFAPRIVESIEDDFFGDSGEKLRTKRLAILQCFLCERVRPVIGNTPEPLLLAVNSSAKDFRCGGYLVFEALVVADRHNSVATIYQVSSALTVSRGLSRFIVD